MRTEDVAHRLNEKPARTNQSAVDFRRQTNRRDQKKATSVYELRNIKVHREISGSSKQMCENERSHVEGRESFDISVCFFHKKNPKTVTESNPAGILNLLLLLSAKA